MTSANSVGLLGCALFPHRFLDLVLDVFFMDFGSILDNFSDDFSMIFASLF